MARVAVRGSDAARSADGAAAAHCAASTAGSRCLTAHQRACQQCASHAVEIFTRHTSSPLRLGKSNVVSHVDRSAVRMPALSRKIAELCSESEFSPQSETHRGHAPPWCAAVAGRRLADGGTFRNPYATHGAWPHVFGWTGIRTRVRVRRRAELPLLTRRELRSLSLLTTRTSSIHYDIAAGCHIYDVNETRKICLRDMGRA
jgi:hypothetical protein